MRHQTRDSPSTAGAGRVELAPAQAERFHALYRDHFDFVFRNLRRLGVPSAAIDDALQDVYIVALRRIDDFQEGTHPKAWLFAIALRVAGNYRRAQRRRRERLALDSAPPATAQQDPFEHAAQGEARRLLHDFLGVLDDNRRAVFIMSELEQLTVPEIARTLSANLNTVYSWLRSARIEFTQRSTKLQGGARRG